MFNFIAEISTLIRATVWLTCLVPLIGFVQPTEAGSKRKPSVLILHTSTSALDTQAKLAATGLFGAVDLFNAAASESATPSLAQLLPYDAVLVSPDYAEPFADNVALGNNLADYVDAGGGVVCNALATCTFSQPAGRWAPNYQVITPGAAPIYFSPQSIDFASVSDPNNQLLIGVGSFSCGAAPRAAQTAVSAGSTVIARSAPARSVTMTRTIFVNLRAGAARRATADAGP